jgi:DNA-binding NtrC family response regulator
MYKPLQKCLILVGDAGIGHKIASMLENCRWQTNVVYSDLHAYDSIKNNHFNTVIADVDTADLGGQDLLAFCHRHYPRIATYAIVRPDDELGKQMAHEAGGCRGYFHLYEREPEG